MPRNLGSCALDDGQQLQGFLAFVALAASQESPMQRFLEAIRVLIFALYNLIRSRKTV